jgi:two-component sensor histidine kinase
MSGLEVPRSRHRFKYYAVSTQSGERYKKSDCLLARFLDPRKVTTAKEIEFRRAESAPSSALLSSPMRNRETQITVSAVALTDPNEGQLPDHLVHLLQHELNHRVKNTLATVQSMISQTLRSAHSTEQARSAIEERLIALSRAHDVLARESWKEANLREIIVQAVEPFSAPNTARVSIRGPDVQVPPRVALPVAMALQELGTNARKYGALSNETGKIRIEWALMNNTPPRLDFRWTEVGGPPVEQPRTRGFGLRLIERSLAHELAGEVRLDFEPNGIVCTVSAIAA